MRLGGLVVVVTGLSLVGCDSCGPRPVSGATPPRPVPSGSAAVAAPSAPALVSAAPSSSAPVEPRRFPAQEITWVYPTTGVGPMEVVLSLPERGAGERFPVLIAMHGRGEAFKGPKRGARGWVDDYAMTKAIGRLHAPPLTQDDFEKLADDKRLAELNRSLEKRPYRGLIVVCPYTPDILAGDKPFSAAAPLAKFLVDELLPRVYSDTPAIGTAATTGVDGVSLGGRASILVGLDRPEAFGDIAALQPAFDSADAPELARRAKAAREKNPKLVFRFLTSDGDFFLNATRNISKAFEGQGVENQLSVVPGPHDYVFNRGPGVYEMLLFHDRSLRGERMLP